MTFVLTVLICLLLFPTTTCMTQGKSKCHLIHCVSWNFFHVACKVTENISSIKLLQQHSFSNCVHGKTFGTYGSQVWVDNGCRGTFEICFGAYKRGHFLYNYYNQHR